MQDNADTKKINVATGFTLVMCVHYRTTQTLLLVQQDSLDEHIWYPGWESNRMTLL